MKQTDINKTLVRDVYKKIIGQRDTSLVHKIVAEDYIQHNPMVKTGRSGLLESLEMLKKFPKSESSHKPFVRMFAERDYVVVHMCVEIFGNKKALIDLFRVEGGLIAEHWDAIEDVSSDTSASGHSIIGGPSEVTDTHLTENNKGLVRDYCETVVLGKNFDGMIDFVATDLIQHHPDLHNGAAALSGYLESFTMERTYRIIGEGNFVLTQSKGVMKHSPYVFYDIYRISAGKIAECWSVKQLIPEVMAHDNGMI